MTVQSYLQKPDSLQKAKAVVVPHAGYIYSGGVAGKVLSSIILPGRIILLGPNHTGWGNALALSPSSAWNTPLGTVSTDAELSRLLLDACPELQENAEAHLKEHCLEVQIPFLQMIRPDCKISAICIGTSNYTALENLGHAMARAIQSVDEPVLLLSSSDMSHYESSETAAGKDRQAIDRIVELDPAGLYRTVIEKNISMCGFGPTVSTLVACLDMGATKGRLVEYTNSGEASGDYSSVVAYAGMTIE